MLNFLTLHVTKCKYLPTTLTYIVYICLINSTISINKQKRQQKQIHLLIEQVIYM